MTTLPEQETRAIVIKASQLENMRDTLQERIDHLREWMDELAKVELIGPDSKVYAYACPKVVYDFFFELQGDLEDWTRFLNEQIGDDAE